MSGQDLAKLEALTKDYAAFQARKSGLATALGGVMAMLMLLHITMPHLLIRWFDWRIVARVVFLMPLLWVPLRHLLGRWLYRGFGTVKAIPDQISERRKWHWIFGLALFLMAFQTLALLGFVNGLLNFVRHPEALGQVSPSMVAKWEPWLWVGGLPWIYLAAAPVCMRGKEEARAYAVLVGQGVIWIAFAFNIEGVNVGRFAKDILVFVFLALQAGVLFWAVLAVKHGWREHREYLSMLRSLPMEEA